MLCNQSRNISYPINLHGFLAQIDVEEDCSWGKVNGSLSEMINSEFIIYNNIYIYIYTYIFALSKCSLLLKKAAKRKTEINLVACIIRDILSS